MSKLFLSANDITIRIYDKFLFEHTSWRMNTNELWLIVGKNGSGKSTFAKALAGLLPLKTGEIILHTINHEFPYPSVHKQSIAYVSFDTQVEIIKQHEHQKDLASYIGAEKKGQTVQEFLGQKHNQLDFFSIEQLLNREIIQLSTGEIRKMFLTKALLKKPQLIILDEPFDGLDRESKIILMEIIENIMKKIPVILISHKIDETPKGITHMMIIDNGKILVQGKKEEIHNQYPELFHDLREPSNKNYTSQIKNNLLSKKENIVVLRNVTVKYENKVALDNVTWTIKKGENWAVLGSNGAGKTTLVHLITGDNLQGYANDITIFGKKKGSGISLHEIKKEIGVVSPALRLTYQKEIAAFDVILSGFFDSIGLYKTANPEQLKIAQTLVRKLHIELIVEKEYQKLSSGQKQIILIARALVKSPKLLILDEPCHGLDKENKARVLATIEEISILKKTQVILITHREDQIIPSITHVLRLEKGKVISIQKHHYQRHIKDTY